MCTFTISKDVYDKVIDIIAASTGCTISNQDVPNYPAITDRRFTHRNIDVLTLARYLALIEHEHKYDFAGEPVEQSFDQLMKEEYSACKNFLKEKAEEEAANNKDGVNGLALSDKEWESLEMAYRYLFKAYAELHTDQLDIETYVASALECQAILNTVQSTTIDGDERESLEETRDTAEQMLIILVLDVLERPDIESGDEYNPLEIACVAFDTLHERDGMPRFDMHATDRLKGIREAVYLLRDSSFAHV